MSYIRHLPLCFLYKYFSFHHHADKTATNMKPTLIKSSFRMPWTMRPWRYRRNPHNRPPSTTERRLTWVTSGICLCVFCTSTSLFIIRQTKQWQTWNQRLSNPPSGCLGHCDRDVTGGTLTRGHFAKLAEAFVHCLFCLGGGQGRISLQIILFGPFAAVCVNCLPLQSIFPLHCGRQKHCKTQSATQLSHIWSQSSSLTCWHLLYTRACTYGSAVWQMQGCQRTSGTDRSDSPYSHSPSGKHMGLDVLPPKRNLLWRRDRTVQECSTLFNLPDSADVLGRWIHHGWRVGFTAFGSC